jgi:hypothetical protein
VNAQRAIRIIARRATRRHHLGIHPQCAMTDLPESQTAVHHYEAALEASCDTLMTLQLIRASAASSSARIGEVEDQITRAINSVQRAITELRLAHTERRSPFLIGFVLGKDLPSPSAPRH